MPGVGTEGGGTAARTGCGAVRGAAVPDGRWECICTGTGPWVFERGSVLVSVPEVVVHPSMQRAGGARGRAGEQPGAGEAVRGAGMPWRSRWKYLYQIVNLSTRHDRIALARVK